MLETEDFAEVGSGPHWTFTSPPKVHNVQDARQSSRPMHSGGGSHWLQYLKRHLLHERLYALAILQHMGRH